VEVEVISVTLATDMSESSLDGVVSPTHRANPMIYDQTEPLSMLAEPDGTVGGGLLSVCVRPILLLDVDPITVIQRR